MWGSLPGCSVWLPPGKWYEFKIVKWLICLNKMFYKFGIEFHFNKANGTPNLFHTIQRSLWFLLFLRIHKVSVSIWLTMQTLIGRGFCKQIRAVSGSRKAEPKRIRHLSLLSLSILMSQYIKIFAFHLTCTECSVDISREDRVKLWLLLTKRVSCQNYSIFFLLINN